MKKYFSLALILLLTLASGLVLVAKSGNTLVFQGDNYVAKINIANNEFTVNNILDIPMYPTIKYKGTVIEPSIGSAPTVAIGQKVTSFTVSFPESSHEEVYASTEVTFYNDFIEQRITIENTHDTDVQEPQIELQPLTQGVFYVFAPYKRIPNAKYLTVSPQKFEDSGQVLISEFESHQPTFEQVQELNIKTDFIRTYAWDLSLGSRSKEDLVIRWSVGYLTNEETLQESIFNPEKSKQYLISTETDPIFTITNVDLIENLAPVAGESETAVDLLQKIQKNLDDLQNTPSAASTLSSLNIDLSRVTSGEQLNSFEKALAFRELARLRGIPAELHYGESGGNYYAWTVAFGGGTTFTYDPAGKKSEYKEIYAEPKIVSCGVEDPFDCPWSAGLASNQFCFGQICLSGYLIIGLILVVLLIVFGVFVYKTEFIYKILKSAPKSKEVYQKNRIEGNYQIIDKEYSAKDPLQQGVYTELKRKEGIVVIVDIAGQTGFSEILVTSAVEKMIDDNVIMKEGGKLIATKKTDKEEKNPTTPPKAKDVK